MATLTVPRGVACINVSSKIPAVLLDDPVFSIFSIGGKWKDIEPTQGNFNWDVMDGPIRQAAAAGKKILLRVTTGGSSATNGGNKPDYVFSLLGADPASNAIIPGVTYSFEGSNAKHAGTQTIPVFFNAQYVAIKNAFMAAVGNHITTGDTLTDAEKAAIVVVGFGYVNGQSDDVAFPQDSGAPGAGYDLNELDRWLKATNASPFPGAGYTTAKMISAVMNNTNSGMLDVVMQHFPNQIVTHAIAGLGPLIDADAAALAGDSDPSNYLMRTVFAMAQAKYPGRFIAQENSVNSIMPPSNVASAHWKLLAEIHAEGYPTGGQMVWFCYQDPNFRVNGGSNADSDNSGLTLTDGQILTKSGTKGFTYGMQYIEVYNKDVQFLPVEVQEIDLLYGGSGIPPTPSDLLGYRAWLTGGPSDGLKIVAPSDTSVTFDKLASSTDYVAHVVPFDEFGDGPEATYPFVTSAAVDPGLRGHPKGVYVLVDATQGPISVDTLPFWKDNVFTGAIYKVKWNQVQQDEATINLDQISKFLALCQTYNKDALISVVDGIYAPTWLFSDGAMGLRVSSPLVGKLAFPWDSIFLAKWATLNTALAMRFDINNKLLGVICSGMGQSSPTLVVDNPADYTEMNDRAIAAGFEDAVDGWEQSAEGVLSTVYNGFAHSLIFLSLGYPVPLGSLPTDGHEGLERLVEYITTGSTNNFNRQVAYLSEYLTGASDASDLINNLIVTNKTTRSVGFAQAFPSIDPRCDPTQTGTYNPVTGFTNMLNVGVALGAHFIIINETDSENAAYATALSIARTGLNTNWMALRDS